jgi:homoserine O-acetyltransferase
MKGLKFLALAVLGALALAGAAHAQLPEAKSETWTIRDFRFHDGSVLPEMKVHYLTLGDPKNPAVLVLHGTGRKAANMLEPGFGGVLFGPGGALDARRFFIVVPDAIGHGDSSKPSDGLRMRFPAFDYDDMVQAQYRLITEHLGVKHLKLLIGTSMGGMQAWLWGEAHPDFIDLLVPMAAQPTQVTARNWIFRRMVIDVIEADPQWNGGNYTEEPKSLGLASTYFNLLFSGGTRAQYAALPTWAATDKAVADALARKPASDANDTIYQYAAARDYDPEPKLGQIKARLLAINSADDERNPAELGITARLVKRVKDGRYYEIPTGPDTRGHGTVYVARLWEAELRKFLAGR